MRFQFPHVATGIFLIVLTTLATRTHTGVQLIPLALAAIGALIFTESARSRPERQVAVARARRRQPNRR